jgi:uncharacterized membrane protein affecting hemolysin expression
MIDSIAIVAMGLAIVVAIAVAYHLAQWINQRNTLRAADQIARTFCIEQASAAATSALWDRLERYRLAKVRANLGAPSSLHAAAAELVREHRLSMLERR